MNIFNIERTFQLKKKRGWDTIYWAIDAHETIFPGKYKNHQEIEVYPGCLEVLKWISDQKNHKIILWTSSYAEHAQEIIKYFKDKYDITFDFFNENSECKNTQFGDFQKKFYFNILIDDKAGFSPKTDWFLIKRELQRIGEWDKTEYSFVDKLKQKCDGCDGEFVETSIEDDWHGVLHCNKCGKEIKRHQIKE